MRSRCLHYIPHLSPIHPDRTLALFLGASASASASVESLTATGASRSINSQDRESADVGKALVRTVLVLQLVVMALQIGVAALHHKRAGGSGVLVSVILARGTERVCSSRCMRAVG